MNRFITLIYLLFCTGHLFSQDSSWTDLIFSHGRGIYDSEINLVISAPHNDAIIYFTSDGSDPSPVNGNIYDSKIRVDSTQPIRAVAYLNGDTFTNVATHTYIFPAQVIRQPEIIEGYPKHLIWVGQDRTNLGWFDNEMDPEIVNDSGYKDEIIPALKSLPSLAIAMDKNKFWEVYSGEAARRTSLELIYPQKPGESEQVYCEIKPHSHNRMKRSMRVVFKKEFGKGKLKSDFLKEATHNGETATDHFDHLILRGGSNRSWASSWYNSKTSYSRDQWFRDNQIMMSGEGIRGHYFHLYINGLYWGVYNITERADENFTSDYFGGDSDNWYSFSHGTEAGDPKRYNTLKNSLIKSDLSIDTNYQKFLNFIDLENYCDYILSSWFVGVVDWPQNNYWGGISNLPAGRLKFFAWDVEHSLRLGWESGYIGGMFTPYGDWEDYIIPGIWQAARHNQDFMAYFSDRVYKHCFNGGVLTADVARSNINAIHDYIRPAMITESARWGDALENLGRSTKTRDENWVAEVNFLNEILVEIGSNFVKLLRRYNYYPSIDPPEFAPTITPSLIDLKISNKNEKGLIVYTINGKDPRNPGGSINDKALTSPNSNVNTSFTEGFTIKARVLYGTEWSALHKAHFINENRPDKLFLTEIMYHPPDSGTVDGKNFEFVELKNLNNSPIDISNVKIIGGIEFLFPVNTILEPGEIIILAEDPAWFEGKYGFEPFGRYKGKLKNQGEYFTAVSSAGSPLWTVDYLNSIPWPEGAVGTNYSIVPSELLSSINIGNPANWRLSFNYGGSPGRDDLNYAGLNKSPFVNEISKILVYPNPVSDRGHILFSNIRGKIKITLYNLSGQHVLNIYSGFLLEKSHTISFNIGHLSSGLYILEINQAGIKYQQKLIVH